MNNFTPMSQPSATFMSAIAKPQQEQAYTPMGALTALQIDSKKVQADAEANEAAEQNLQAEINALQKEVAELNEVLKNAETDYMYNQRKQTTDARKQDLNALSRAYRQDVFNMDGSLSGAIERIGAQDVADATAMSGREMTGLQTKLQKDEQVANSLVAEGRTLQEKIDNLTAMMPYQSGAAWMASNEQLKGLQGRFSEAKVKLDNVNEAIKNNPAYSESTLHTLSDLGNQVNNKGVKDIDRIDYETPIENALKFDMGKNPTKKQMQDERMRIAKLQMPSELRDVPNAPAYWKERQEAALAMFDKNIKYGEEDAESALAEEKRAEERANMEIAKLKRELEGMNVSKDLLNAEGKKERQNNLMKAAKNSQALAAAKTANVDSLMDYLKAFAIVEGLNAVHKTKAATKDELISM